MESVRRLFRCCGCGSDDDPRGEAFDSAVALSTKPSARSGSILGSKLHASGAGQILADQAVLQDRGYWEVSVEQAERLSVGVASAAHTLGNPLGDGATSWALHSVDLPQVLQPGDVIGVALDQADFPVSLRFYVNGTQYAEVRGPATESTPIVHLYSSTDAVAVNFGLQPFARPPPSGGYSGLLRSRSIL